MKITWFGTASVKLEFAGERILFDPYVRTYGNAEEKLIKSYQKEDTIMITHGHFDHIGDLVEIYGDRQDVAVYATETPIKTLLRDGMSSEVLHQVAPGMCVQLKNFKVNIYKSKHIQYNIGIVLKKIFSFRTYRWLGRCIRLLCAWTRYPENGETVLYDVQTGEKHVQILGSAALAKEVAYPTNADVLLLAYQGRTDMTQYVVNMISRLQPKAVMPIHFDDAFPPISGEVDMDAFLRMMGREFPDIKVMIPQVDVTYEV